MEVALERWAGTRIITRTQSGPEDEKIPLFGQNIYYRRAVRLRIRRHLSGPVPQE